MTSDNHSFCFTVGTHYEITLQQAISFIRHDLMSMSQKELCVLDFCTARPDETVPQNLLVVGGGKGEEGVGLVEIKYVLTPLDVVHFHAVGRGEDVELGANQIQFLR